MNTQELSQYLADAPPSVVRLEIEKHFEALTNKQKAYAHHISRYDSVTILDPFSDSLT
jgi:dipeptidyl-peptidase-3